MVVLIQDADSTVAPTVLPAEPVQAGTVEDALLAVGVGIVHLDQPDPCKQAGSDWIHPLLSDHLTALR